MVEDGGEEDVGDVPDSSAVENSSEESMKPARRPYELSTFAIWEKVSKTIQTINTECSTKEMSHLS